MADIIDEINKIKNSVSGEMVRDAFIDGLKKIAPRFDGLQISGSRISEITGVKNGET